MVSYRLDVSIKPGAPAGPVRDEIRLLTNDTESQGFPILVTAEVRGDLTATPNRLALTSANPSTPAQGRYVIRSSKPFKFTSIEGIGDGFTATPDNTEAKPIHVVTVTFKPEPGKPQPAPSRTFTMMTDLPGEGPVVVMATIAGGQ